jgi:excisionase family DNA binding protein
MYRASDLYNENLNLISKRVYTLTEAAAIVGISYSLMRKFVKQGKIKTMRVGKRLMVPEAEVEKLLKELIEERR